MRIGGGGWYQEPAGRLILHDNEIRFDSFISETEEWESVTMIRTSGGLYDYRGENGKEHWTCFLSETKTHVYLAGNFINFDGSQGVPQSELSCLPCPQHRLQRVRCLKFFAWYGLEPTPTVSEAAAAS